MEIRELRRGDLDRVLELNQAEVPAVGTLDGDRLARLVSMAEAPLVAEDHDGIVGFVIALPPGVDYGSENYRWFSDRYDDFTYIDRVAVSPAAQRRGVGAALYDAVEAATSAPFLLCEVNLRPRNDPSLRFHARRGFRPVGEQETGGGAFRVVLLEKRLGDGL